MLQQSITAVPFIKSIFFSETLYQYIGKLNIFETRTSDPSVKVN